MNWRNLSTENHSEHQNNHRDVSIHSWNIYIIVEIKILSVIPATNFNNVDYGSHDYFSIACLPARPPIRGASFELFWCLKPRPALDRLASSHARHSINVESLRVNAVLRKSTTSRFVPANFGKRTAGITPPPSSRYENPSPDPSRIISRVENLENVRTFDRHFEYRSRLFHSLVLGVSNVDRWRMDRGSILRSYNFTRGKFRECILFLFHRHFDYYFRLYIIYFIQEQWDREWFYSIRL